MDSGGVPIRIAKHTKGHAGIIPHDLFHILMLFFTGFDILPEDDYAILRSP